MVRTQQWISVGFAMLLVSSMAWPAWAEVIAVSNDAQFRSALQNARAGDRIELAAGEYRGGMLIEGLVGTADLPIIIAGADPKRRPIIRGRSECLHLSNVRHVQLHDLELVDATGNGLNIDDGGTFDSPSHHIVLRNLLVHKVGPKGNHDGIKLSGLQHFRVENCTIKQWGEGGSAIDMVGCSDGVITGCRIEHTARASTGVQAKGGTRDVTVQRCDFRGPIQRGVNAGGSTGLAYFRPKPQGYEAKNITVEHCTFGGCMPIAFVGVDGATFRRNTVYRPSPWFLRILQETRSEGFVPSRNGRVEQNVFVYRAGELRSAVNVGDATEPNSFRFASNVWYCIDQPSQSKPQLPTRERGGVYGVNPNLIDPEQGDLRIHPGSRVRGVGAERAD